MKILSIAAAALAALFVMQNPAPAAEKESPTYIENQTILDAFGKTGAPPLVPGEQYNVAANRRTANGQVEIHEKETDILLVVDGSATFVTGGKAIEPTTTRRAAKPTTSRKAIWSSFRLANHTGSSK